MRFKGFTSLVLCLLLSGCSTFKPTDLDYSEVETDQNNPPMEFGVYTPPGWTDKESLPLIVFLHGGGNNHTSFEKFGAHRYFDQQINDGKMPRVILVSPNGGFGLWENWADGTKHYRDWVLNKAVPVVQNQYKTLPCPKHCHLMGISMGGFGVLRFAYYASDQFSSIRAISAPIIQRRGQKKPKTSWLVKLFIPLDRIFGESFKSEFYAQDPFNAWVDDPGLKNMRLQLIWGSGDRPGIRDVNQKLHQHLQEKGIQHDAYEYAGNHKWVAWKPHFNRVVNFLVNPAYRP